MLAANAAMLNGVDCAALGATIEFIEHNPELARFRFSARNQWLSGGQNRSSIQEFYGGCAMDTRRTRPFVFDAGAPPLLLGKDEGAHPAEYLLHALVSCMTTSMAYHAALRGIEVRSIASRVEGGLDLRGFLGVSKDVRKGYQQIRVAFEVASDAPADLLHQCALMSPVLDCVGRAVPVEVSVRVSK